MGNTAKSARRNSRAKSVKRDAVWIRAAASRTLAGEPPKKGGILAALRRSPLVGADLDLARSREDGR
jgi:hypothetical protein